MMHNYASEGPPGKEANLPAPVLTSARFNPKELAMRDTDLILLSGDRMRFYVHKDTLLRHSSNRFGSLLPEPSWERDIEIEMFRFVNIPELAIASCGEIAMEYTTAVLNAVLHVVYGLSVRPCLPSPSTLRKAITALAELGYDLHEFLNPHSELFALSLQAAAAEPLLMYALAAQHSLESLAVSVSALTLEVSPMTISDQLAEQMGAVYLRRLCGLHLDRTNSLKRLLSPPPVVHPFVLYSSCKLDVRQSISHIWTFASSFAIFANHPNDLPRTLAPFIEELQCMRCRKVLQDRVQVLLRDWSDIKSTI